MTTPPSAPGDETLADQQRYRAAAHAMQTGVAYELELDPSPGTPKHLRVGVNSSMVEHSALTRLLITKGVITWAEYYGALADAMETERDLYAARLSAHFGRPITLA
jgi:hypothetical protein